MGIPVEIIVGSFEESGGQNRLGVPAKRNGYGETGLGTSGDDGGIGGAGQSRFTTIRVILVEGGGQISSEQGRGGSRQNKGNRLGGYGRESESGQREGEEFYFHSVILILDKIHDFESPIP